jgi:2-polyprenyl-6-methoxyphenol hydroxylase-like FAD-dependent oxidoreductase
VGLFLAATLLQHGVDVQVLEQRRERNAHSRAIGIHPPALAALETVGVAADLVKMGVPIRRGLAVDGRGTVAEMSFDTVSDRFPFVLSVPQVSTESLLEQRVRELNPEALVRGAQVTGMHDDGGSVTVDVAGGQGPSRVSSRLAVGADGYRSTMRRLLRARTKERNYPEHYLMGDFADSTPHGPDAALYLAPEGIVESFPLPNALRRWVVRLDRPLPHADAGELARLILSRTGVLVRAETNVMLSSFGVRARLVRKMVHGRSVLIGDAAHEISPIGGQGMNLGWLDAAALAPIILDALRGAQVSGRLDVFDRSRRRAAARAAWQSEVNMTLGRPMPRPLLTARNAVLGNVLLVPPVNALLARRFTMQ